MPQLKPCTCGALIEVNEMPVITTEYLGGEPRVTISRCGDNVTVKLLGVRRITGTARQSNSAQVETTAIAGETLPMTDVRAIREAALRLSRYGGNCWVWDSCDCGAAKIHQAEADGPEITDDPLGF